MPSLSTRARVTALTATIAAFAAAGTVLSACADAVATPGNVVVTPSGPGQVTVSWDASSAAGVRDWQVVLAETDSDGTITHWQFAAPSARSLVIPNLPTGAQVRAAVSVFNGTADVNGSAVSPKVAVPGGLCAGVVGACVSADGTTVLGTEGHIAQGFLHGLTMNSTGAANTAALHPTSWRITEASPQEMSGVARYDTSVTAVLSDTWLELTHDALGHARSPWQDWAAYTNFVTTQVRNRVADGNLPAYWDIQNEPDVTSYYNPLYPVTRALLLQQYRVAYDAIKSVLPTAQVIGPSIGTYLLRGNATYLGLLDFIDYATQNDLQFAGVSWHELQAGLVGHNSGQLPMLADRIETVRTALAQSSVMAGAKILINEYESPQTQGEVGWDLGHVTALESAGVDQADRTCWNGCSGNDVLDSVLSADGETPRMTYWGRLAYAQMQGERVQPTSSAHDTTVLATAAADGSVTALVTRHHGCALADNPACSVTFAAPTPTGPLTLVVRMPARKNGHVVVTVTPLSSTTADVPSAPTPVQSTAGAKRGGVVALSLGNLADASAYVVTVHYRSVHYR
jgi:hypothetical protein